MPSPEDTARKILDAAKHGHISPVYIFVGERPRTLPPVRELLGYLLPDGERDANLETFAGDAICAENVLAGLLTCPLFPGRKVVWLRDPPFLRKAQKKISSWEDVISALRAGDGDAARDLAVRSLRDMALQPNDLRGLPEGKVRELLGWKPGEPLAPFLDLIESIEPLPPLPPAPAPSAADTLEDHLKAWMAGKTDPDVTVLLIEAEEVDRRGKTWSFFKQNASLVDLGVQARDRKTSREHAAGLIRQKTGSEGKKMDGKAVDLLLDRVGGDDLVALEAEIEKLLIYAGERKTIGVADVEAVSSLHRDGEIFVLTEALGQKDPAESLASLGDLLDQGVHPLAVFQAIVNFLKRILLFKAYLDQGGAASLSCTYNAFTERILPGFKAFSGEETRSAVSGLHPYALYRISQHAAGFRTEDILYAIMELPEVDLALKGGAASARIVLEKFILQSIIH